MFSNLLLETANGVQTIIINRPDKLNALNKQTLHELHMALQAANTDTSVRAVIISGSGEKAFVAGADISEFANYSIEEGKMMASQGHLQVFDFIENMSKPAIAAINGFALGGGLELAMSCHIRIASDNARLGLPEVTLGIIPGYGGTQRLPKLVGRGKAIEMISTASMLNAEEALQWGLVNHVVAQTELMVKANEIAGKIAKNSPNAIKQALIAINAGFDSKVNGYHAEIEAFGECFQSKEFLEGTQAFMEKRKPNFA